MKAYQSFVQSKHSNQSNYITGLPEVMDRCCILKRLDYGAVSPPTPPMMHHAECSTTQSRREYRDRYCNAAMQCNDYQTGRQAMQDDVYCLCAISAAHPLSRMTPSGLKSYHRERSLCNLLQNVRGQLGSMRHTRCKAYVISTLFATREVNRYKTKITFYMEG